MNLDDARRFLAALQPDDDRFFFATLDDSGRGSKRLITERFATLDQHAHNLERLNNDGAGVFVCVNRTDETGRRKAANVVGVRAIFVDLDGSPLEPTLASKPSLVVETSPGRYHVYWVVSDCEPKDWKAAQHALAARFNGDPSVCDLPRLVRLPGFEHRKSKPFLSHVQHLGETRPRTMAELARVIGFATTKQPKAKPEIKLTGRSRYAETALRLEVRNVAEAEEGTRNMTLNRAAFALGQLVASGHLDESTVIAELTAASQLDELETQTTIRSGLTAGRAQPREIPERTRAVDAESAGVTPKLRMILERDTDTEFARWLECKLKIEFGVAPIYTAGSFWAYSFNGYWVPLSDESIGQRIQAVDGELRTYVWKDGERKTNKETGELITRIIEVQAATIRDVIASLKILAHQERFFESAKPGFVFSNGFVEVDAIGIRISDNSPHNRARAGWPFAYRPDAPCDRWFRFLSEVWDGHEDLAQRVSVLSEFLGACLVGRATAYQKCVVLLGDGSNGKSILLDLVRKLFPDEVVASSSPQSWNELGRGEYHRAMLDGKLVNILAELPAKDVESSDAFKAIVTGDRVAGRHPGARPFFFRPIAGHLVAANALPAVRDSSHGFWRRFVVLTFDRRFSSVDAEAPESLSAELASEIPGVLAWALEGAQRAAQAGSYTAVPSSSLAVAEWQIEGDQVSGWLSDAAHVLAEDERGGMYANEAYRSYASWASDNGHRELSASAFGKRLKQIVPWRRVNSGILYLIGNGTRKQAIQ